MPRMYYTCPYYKAACALHVCVCVCVPQAFKIIVATAACINNRVSRTNEDGDAVTDFSEVLRNISVETQRMIRVGTCCAQSTHVGHRTHTEHGTHRLLRSSALYAPASMSCGLHAHTHTRAHKHTLTRAHTYTHAL